MDKQEDAPGCAAGFGGPVAIAQPVLLLPGRIPNRNYREA